MRRHLRTHGLSELPPRPPPKNHNGRRRKADVREGQSPVGSIDPDARCLAAVAGWGLPEPPARTAAGRAPLSLKLCDVGYQRAAACPQRAVARRGGGRPLPSSPGPAGGPPPGAPSDEEAELSPEERAAAEEYARQLDAARQQLLEAPAGLVVGQQALQFYEVAALHLSQPEPKLEEARIAIDALAAVVDALGPRLGEAHTPPPQPVHQGRLPFGGAWGGGGPPADG